MVKGSWRVCTESNGLIRNLCVTGEAVLVLDNHREFDLPFEASVVTAEELLQQMRGWMHSHRRTYQTVRLHRMLRAVSLQHHERRRPPPQTFQPRDCPLRPPTDGLHIVTQPDRRSFWFHTTEKKLKLSQ
jgi:hypothetical protein